MYSYELFMNVHEQFKIISPGWYVPSAYCESGVCLTHIQGVKLGNYDVAKHFLYKQETTLNTILVSWPEVAKEGFVTT